MGQPVTVQASQLQGAENCASKAKGIKQYISVTLGSGARVPEFETRVGKVLLIGSQMNLFPNPNSLGDRYSLSFVSLLFQLSTCTDMVSHFVCGVS